MLAKKFRLPLGASHGERGRRIASPHLRATILPAQRSYGRFGVIVGKKVAKSAVVRNKIRRMLYEAIRKSSRISSLEKDVVVTVLPGSVGVAREKMVAELSILLQEVAGDKK